MGVAVGILYHGIVARLVREWWHDPNASHGFLIPVFSVFVLWRQRGRLAEVVPRPSWSGLAVIVAALGILILGVLGAELLLSRSSLVFLLAGLAVLFFGWAFFRRMLFPWACLFLMIPIPAIILNIVTFPLQLLASRISGTALAFFGVPVLRQGNILTLPAISLEVAEACSGIRSLISLMALAVIYGYLLEPRLVRRALLVAAAIPIAVLANGMRIVGTGLLVQYWDQARAEGFFHAFEGWVIFGCATVMLFGSHRAMGLVDRWRSRRQA